MLTRADGGEPVRTDPHRGGASAIDRGDLLSGNRIRLTNEAWESPFGHKIALARTLSTDGTWDELHRVQPPLHLVGNRRGLRLADVKRRALIAQAGVPWLGNVEGLDPGSWTR